MRLRGMPLDALQALPGAVEFVEGEDDDGGDLAPLRDQAEQVLVGGALLLQGRALHPPGPKGLQKWPGHPLLPLHRDGGGRGDGVPGALEEGEGARTGEEPEVGAVQDTRLRVLPGAVQEFLDHAPVPHVGERRHDLAPRGELRPERREDPLRVDQVLQDVRQHDAVEAPLRKLPERLLDR